MKKLYLVCALAFSVLFTSCEVLQGVLSQLTDMANLANCEYSLKNVSNVTVAGVNVKNITDGNIKAADVVKLSAAILSKNVPLVMDVNVNVKNPTTSNASLTNMDWICEIDGTQFANGTTNKTYTISPNATTAVPLSVNTDIYSMFSKDGLESLKTFVNSFNNDGTSSKVALKIKPSVNIGGVSVPAPNYIKLEKATGTNSNNSVQTGTVTPNGKK